MRVLFAFGAYVYRISKQDVQSGKILSSPQGPYFFEERKDKKGNVRSIKLSVEHPSQIHFRISEESRVDRFFKWLGVSDEIQTHNKSFDEYIYITCDHSSFAGFLRCKPQTQQLLINLFRDGFNRVTAGGHFLSFSSSKIRSLSDYHLSAAFELRDQLKDLSSSLTARYRDPFIWKALAAEALVWSIAAYAIGGVIEMMFHGEDYHLNQWGIFRVGLVMGGLLFAVLFAIIVFFLKGSSRSHRIITESALVLILSLPFTGTQIASGLNRSLDKKPSIQFRGTIMGSRHEVRRSRRTTTHHYYIQVATAPQQGITVPPEIEVSRSLFMVAVTSKGRPVNIQVGPGFLAQPWYRQIHIY